MKRSPAIEKKILALIVAGNSGVVAAASLGVAKTTFHAWMHDDPNFRDRVRGARAKAETVAVKALRSHMAKDPKMAVEWLKRARWKTWEPAKRIEATVREASKLTDEELKTQLEAELAKLKGKTK